MDAEDNPDLWLGRKEPETTARATGRAMAIHRSDRAGIYGVRPGAANLAGRSQAAAPAHRRLAVVRLPNLPRYCRARPTESFPCFGKHVSSMILMDRASAWLEPSAAAPRRAGALKWWSADAFDEHCLEPSAPIGSCMAIGMPRGVGYAFNSMPQYAAERLCRRPGEERRSTKLGCRQLETGKSVSEAVPRFRAAPYGFLRAWGRKQKDRPASGPL